MNDRKKHTVDGMPFSLVGLAATDPMAWLASLARNADFLLALLERERPAALTPGVRNAVAATKRHASLAEKAIACDMATESAYASIRALQSAWIVEGLLGFEPRVRKANASTTRSRAASEKAAQVHRETAAPHLVLARELAKKVPEAIRASGNKSDMARRVKAMAAKSKDPVSARLANLGERQISTLVFGKPKSGGKDRR